MIWLLAYLATIPAANYAITTFGVVPVGFGLLAPAGVLFAGLAFTCRDMVQERYGRAWTLGAIGGGALLSLAVSDPFVAAASALAFLVSEVADFAVYTPLRKRGLLVAVAASNVVGFVADSLIFLSLAFGDPWTFLPGLLLGKLWTIPPALVLLAWLRARRTVGVTA